MASANVIELRAITSEMRRNLAKDGILVRDALPSNLGEEAWTLIQECSEFTIWSGVGHPPAIGKTVTVRDYGRAVVIAYYTQRISDIVYLGVLVDLIDAPASWCEINPRGTPMKVRGDHIAPLKLAA